MVAGQPARFHGKFFVEPAAKSRDLFGNVRQWGGGIDRTFDPWFLSLDGNVLSAWVEQCDPPMSLRTGGCL